MRCATLSRLAARTAAQSSRRHGSRRGLSSTAAKCAASNFLMPAMSPTMTEGNIATWKIKEGESFSPGDVLLEIETDKAQMDVEAQEEGVLAKILQQDGTKSIPVGSRIAVLAEEGDDLSSLEIPPKPTESKSMPPSTSEPPSATAHPAENTPSSSDAASSSKLASQKYPLYPSVQMLLHQKGLGLEEANKIPSSGPQGRLLKGDVLAYLGQIKRNKPQELADSLSKLAHLDLSNIQVAAPKAATPSKSEHAPTPVQEPEIEPDTEIAVPISLHAVLETRSRIKTALGVELPLSTFIARASDLANSDLPQPKTPATADELFDAVLGLKTVPKTSTGNYFPLVTGLEDSTLRAPLTKTLDIIDVLTAGPKKPARAFAPSRQADQVDMSTNGVFSLSVQKSEERRARVYLERLKAVLEVEPGQLVL